MERRCDVAQGEEEENILPTFQFLARTSRFLGQRPNPLRTWQTPSSPWTGRVRTPLFMIIEDLTSHQVLPLVWRHTHQSAISPIAESPLRNVTFDFPSQVPKKTNQPALLDSSHIRRLHDFFMFSANIWQNWLTFLLGTQPSLLHPPTKLILSTQVLKTTFSIIFGIKSRKQGDTVLGFLVFY